MEETSKKVRHTPGPLEIWGRQEKTEISGFYMIGSAESEVIMGCTAYVCSEHDAKLYCAAPSLLEALEAVQRLKQLLEYPREVSEAHVGEAMAVSAMISKVEEAIKLAKGEIKTELI